MVTADLRCNVKWCSEKGIYRMIGRCSNCNTENVLILFTAGHDSSGSHRCPVCECSDLRAARLATEDEIPVA